MVVIGICSEYFLDESSSSVVHFWYLWRTFVQRIITGAQPGSGWIFQMQSVCIFINIKFLFTPNLFNVRELGPEHSSQTIIQAWISELYLQVSKM
jgi:hypothetical protein